MEKLSTDCLQPFIFENADIRGVIVTLADSLNELFDGQNYETDKQVLLAEFIAANILLASHLKFEGSISLQAQSTAGFDLMMAECSDSLHYRGILKGKNSLAGMSFSEIFAGGMLVLTMMPKNGAQYQGVVPTESSSLADCLQDYFSQSEQLATWFFLSAIKGRVMGLMLQAMPAHVCLDPEQSEEHWNRIVHLASTITQQEVATLSHEELLYRLYHEEQVRIFEPKKVCYQCNCSVERMERGLLTLGVKDLEELLVDQEVVKTQCHFCNKEYHFTRHEIMQLIQGAAQHKTH